VSVATIDKVMDVDLGELLGDLPSWIALIATALPVMIGKVLDVELGDLSSWVTALVTAAALGAAIYAGRHAAKLLRIETERDREREDNERRGQASLVAAWRGVVPLFPNVPANNDGTYGPVVRNGSELPIYQVQVEILPIGQTTGTHVFIFEVLPPGQWFVHTRDGGIYTTRPVTLDPELKKDPEYQVAVSFRDAAGATWRRDQYGILQHTGTTVFLKPASVAVTPGGLTITQSEPDDSQRRWFHPWFPRRKRAPVEYPDMSWLKRALWRRTNRVPRPSVRPEDLVTHVTRCPPRR